MLQNVKFPAAIPIFGIFRTRSPYGAPPLVWYSDPRTPLEAEWINIEAVNKL